MRAQEPLLLIKASGTLLTRFIDDALNQLGVLTRALANTRSGHCNGQIESSKEKTKSLLFFLLNGLADLLDLKLLEL